VTRGRKTVVDKVCGKAFGKTHEKWRRVADETTK
jgi:hypothetical protein